MQPDFTYFGRMHPRRVTICSILFASCCLLSSARLVLQAPRPRDVKASAEKIPRQSDLRFAELRKNLPARGVVGYWGDSALTPPAVGAYYLTQYALAPLVVERSLKHPLVVGNFPDSAAPPVPANLRLVKDFGDGVFLFAAEDAR